MEGAGRAKRPPHGGGLGVHVASIGLTCSHVDLLTKRAWITERPLFSLSSPHAPCGRSPSLPIGYRRAASPGVDHHHASDPHSRGVLTKRWGEVGTPCPVRTPRADGRRLERLLPHERPLRSVVGVTRGWA